MTAAEIDAVLRKRFAWPEWVMFTEVYNGMTGSRRADAVAMNMWSSRGFLIMGFEIKVDRGDLLKELKTPRKAEETGMYCDKWSLVTPAGLVKETDLLPDGWGLFEVHPSGMFKVKITPGKREAKIIDRNFVSIMLRRAAEQDERNRMASIHAAAKKLAELEVKQVQDSADRNMQFLKQRHERLTQEVDSFQKATGLMIRDSYEVSQAIRVIKSLGAGRVRGRIDEIIGSYDRISGDIKELREMALQLKDEMKGGEAS